MGRKQNRTGKYIYFCVAGLTLLFVFGCASLIDKEDHLVRSQMLIVRGDFEGALEENQKVLFSYVSRPPADEAIFNMGLIYAHYGNPNKDYKKAFSFFWRLIKEFPQSPLYEEAKIWTGILNTIEETKMKMEGQMEVQRSADDHIVRSQRLIAKGDFEGAIEENQKVLFSYVSRPPADEAIFNMGLIYAHYGNPNKDYKKAFSFFWRLIKEFPQSPLYEEAKIWTGILNTIEETKMKMEGQMEVQRSAYDHIVRSQRLIVRGDFEGALEENQKVLYSCVGTPPADEAIFNMGLIYAHYGNPNKDYKKAFSFFRRLIKEFPQSPLYEEAKIWTGILNTIEETKMKMEGQQSAYDPI